MSKLIAQFEQLDNDHEKWQWLVLKQGLGLVVVCDNDVTMLIDRHLQDRQDEDPTIEETECCAYFEDHIGWSDGVVTLLAAMGIEGECC